MAFAIARPTMTEKLGAELLKLVAPTRAELGCQRYEIHQNLDDPQTWVIIETWCARSDFEVHMRTSHVQNFLAKVPSLCVRDVEIGEYREASATNHGGGKS